MIRILGIDPGSRATGYGIIEMHGNRLAHIAHGAISTSSSDPLPARLAAIFLGLRDVLALHRPAEVGVENIFNAHNAQSALKLGHARGVALLAAELERLPLEEYTPMQVKSAVVGYGHATKEQVQEMVRRLLALPERVGADASDALAVAICHAQTRSTLQAYARAVGARAAKAGPQGVRK